MSENEPGNELENKQRDSLIAMVRAVQNSSACTMDFDGMLSRLEEKIQYKQIGNLIFDPPGGKPLTAEEIVDQAFELRKNS